MIDEKNRALAESTIRLAYGVAIIDLTLATICAINGSGAFVDFIVLSGLMYAYGRWLQGRIDNTGE
jgi:hypothetical protein